MPRMRPGADLSSQAAYPALGPAEPLGKLSRRYHLGKIHESRSGFGDHDRLPANMRARFPRAGDCQIGKSGLRLQPICSCLRLIFLKITFSRLAREQTAVSVRPNRIPIARTLNPASANLRSLSSSACVHGREAKFAGSDIGRPVSRAPSFKTPSMSWCIDHSPAALPPQGT